MIEEINVIDLFCGCGGFSKGFEEAGFNICFGIDMWKDATVTYQHNFSNAVVLNEDITKISGEDILKMCSLQATEVDVIIGGPPCQGFSVSGKRMIDDERNRLYKSYVNIVSIIKPKAFVMENVPGLVRLFKGKVAEQVKEDFTNIGYSVQMKNIICGQLWCTTAKKKGVFCRNTEKIYRKRYKVFLSRANYGRGNRNKFVDVQRRYQRSRFCPR